MHKVIDFLVGIRHHNTREWFETNRSLYLSVKTEIEAFAAKLIDGIAMFDPSVRGLEVKDCTYRINRDIRFSNNKDPYKTHIGIYVCPGGKKSNMAGYYIHIEPAGDGFAGGNLLTAGIYMPEPAVLKAIREEIFENGDELMANIAKAGGFDIDRSNTLKRTPAGYPAGSHWDEFLKLKDLYLTKHISDSYILADNLLEHVLRDLETTGSFVAQLNKVVALVHEDM